MKLGQLKFASESDKKAGWTFDYYQLSDIYKIILDEMGEGVSLEEIESVLHVLLESGNIQPWISVKDKLPSDLWREEFGDDCESLAEEVLVYFDDGEDPEVGYATYSVSSGWLYSDFSTLPTNHVKSITHWKRFPDGPKGG